MDNEAIKPADSRSTAGARGGPVLAASCAAIFWPGAFIFGFPGVMGRYWQQTLGVDRAAIGGTLFFVLAAAGIAMFLTGRLMSRFGPARLTAGSAVLCGLGVLLVSRAEGIGTVYLYAFLVGASSAFIYLPALTVVQAWFPGRRGLVSGLVNMVFALSAALMAPVFSAGLDRFGYRSTSIALGLVALAVGLAAAPFMKLPAGRIQSVPGSRRLAVLPAVSFTTRQAARLAAVLPNPWRYRPVPPSAYVLERSRWIEQQMQQLGSAWIKPVTGQ